MNLLSYHVPILIVSTGLLFACAIAESQAQEMDEASLADAVEALVSRLQAAKSADAVGAIAGDIARLRKQLNGDTAPILQALARRQARHADPDRQLPYLAFIRFMNPEEGALVRACVPLLSSKDKVLREIVEIYLNPVDRPMGISAYTAFIGRDLDTPLAQVALERMVQVSPSEAMLMMAGRLEGDRRVGLLLAVHQVDDMLFRLRFGLQVPEDVSRDAKAALEMLAREPEWWIRLYVPMVLSKVGKELDVEGFRAILKTDPDERVRSVMDQ